MSTWSAAPIITHDQPDKSGVRAEVKVVMGYGNVRIAEKSDKGSNKLEFSVDNSQYKPSGRVNDTEEAVMALVNQAVEEGSPIFFRIETVRKSKVDRELPIVDISKTTDLAREHIYKNIAAVRLAESDNWTFSSRALTDPREDPVADGPGRNPALDPNSAAPAPAAPAGGQTSAQRAAIEPAPYVTFCNDGRLNVGSIAVSVPLNVYAYVTEYIRSQPTEQAHLYDLDEKARVRMTRAILQVANEMQLTMFRGDLEKPDLSAGSHTRARAILFELCRTSTPFDASIANDQELLTEWMENAKTRGLKMWKWSAQLVGNMMR